MITRHGSVSLTPNSRLKSRLKEVFFGKPRSGIELEGLLHETHARTVQF